MNMRNPNLTFVVNAIKATGADIPDAITQAIDDQNRIVQVARQMRSNTSGYGALADAWANAVLDGRDPADDREVFRALLGASLAEGDIEYAATNAVNSRAIEHVKEIQDDILKIFKDAFDAAGRTLAKAHGILGSTRLESSNTIFELGPVAVQAYQDANEARRLTRVIDMGWNGLNALTHFAPGTAERSVKWANPDINTWEKVRRMKDTWDMTIAGVTLDLAIDSATITERWGRLNSERTERDTAPDNRERDARRQQGAATLAGIAAAKAAMA